MAVFRATTDPEVSVRERENQNRVRELAVECMVLLRNDGNVLPLDGPQKIALFGNGAKGTIKGGTGSGDVYVRRSVNIYEGLLEEGFTITNETWFKKQDDIVEQEHKAFIDNIIKTCEEAGTDPTLMLALKSFNATAVALVDEEDVKESATDTAVYVIARTSGEGNDRDCVPGDYLLSEADEANIRFLKKNFKKTIVLLNIGGVIQSDVLKAEDGPDAVVLVGQLGNIGGLAVADMLKGKGYPAGRLTDTWAVRYEDYASSPTFSHNDGDIEDEFYTEGIYTGYRYFDTFNITPAYEFGYGLSYTTFDVKAVDTAVEKDKITVKVNVKNTGDVPGKEVIQVYVSAPKGEIDKPYQELKAFGKTKELAPGEEQVLSLEIKAASLASYSEAKAAWVLEKGAYIIRVGTSSRKSHVAALVVLDDTVITKKVRNLFNDPERKADLVPENVVPYSYPEELDEIKAAPAKALKAEDIPVIEVAYSGEHEITEDKNPGTVITMDDVYAGRYTVQELASQLTIDELIKICVGNFDENTDPNDMMAVLGHASLHLPGCAGETTELVKGRALPVLELCDGPAGLRLTPVFLGKEDGTFVGLSPIYNETVSEEYDTAEYTKYYQYCTAIPIAFTLAASWNMDILKTCGDIVGSEMEEFGATLWLAPGMNNHRNPLCGRNFEYYSEDPLLAGKCAAADTEGVQRHKGIGTTIKHFAANNQEDNRMFTNSHVSERAMREIYLRSFEITVTESQPMAIMTSYNLINGVHAANYKDMLQNTLRDEWGFEGIVMTDWLTTSSLSKGLSFDISDKYDKASPALCMKAGNDLIEPGTMEDIREITEAYEKGEVTRNEISACAERILSLMLKSSAYPDAKPYFETAGHKNITFTAE